MYYSTYNIHYIKNRAELTALMEGMSRIAEGNPYNPTSTHGNVYWLFGQYLDKRCSSSPHHPLLTNLILTRSLLLRKFPSPNPLTQRNWFGLFISSSSLSSPRWAFRPQYPYVAPQFLAYFTHLPLKYTPSSDSVAINTYNSSSRSVCRHIQSFNLPIYTHLLHIYSYYLLFSCLNSSVLNSSGIP